MKKKAKIILMASIAAFIASVYSLAAAAAYQPDNANSPSSVFSPEPNSEDAISSEAFRTKIIKIYNGQIAVFEENTDTPIDILGANVQDLPENTIKQLNEGITVTTQNQYLSYLEDFS